jgi:hypothetical protein
MNHMERSQDTHLDPAQVSLTRGVAPHDVNRRGGILGENPCPHGSEASEAASGQRGSGLGTTLAAAAHTRTGASTV